MKKIAVLGAGGFGTSLAALISGYNYPLTLWSAVPSEIEDIRLNGENKKFLPGIKLDTDKMKLTTSTEDISDADIIIFAVASVYVRKVAKAVSPYVKKDAILVNVGKGLEEGSLKRLSQVICEEITDHAFVALSGPSHAEEIARGIPTTIVAASTDQKAAEEIQDILNSATLRIYVNNDIIGVEIGAALKNIIALAAGICDGLGLGDNSKAALMTRGITEIGRLGVAVGAKTETFAGLSGIGDLIVTCTSMHSRNRRAGILIGKGKTPEEAVKEIGATVEGYFATKTAYCLAKKHNVSMPITEQLYNVLYNGADAKNVSGNLMGRPTRNECEELWFKESN